MTTQSDISLNGSLPSTRSEARASGASHYLTGKECCSGHLSIRKTVNGHCIECERARDRRRAEHKENLRKIWREKNRSRRNATEQAWRDANRERVRQQQRHRYRLHHTKIRAKRLNEYKERTEYFRRKRQEDRENNREKYRAWGRRFYYANPEMAKVRAKNRYARRKSADGSFSKDDLVRIRAAQGDKCACCRKKLYGKGHVDHIQSLNKGGSNWPSNLQILCVSCNCAKIDKDPIDFMQSRGFLL